MAIPALLYAAYRTRSQALLSILALSSIVIDFELYKNLKIDSAYYLWTAPVWLLWYLLARSCASEAEVEHFSNRGELKAES